MAVFSNIWLDGRSYPVNLTIDVESPVGPESVVLYQIKAVTRHGHKVFEGQGRTLETAVEQLLAAYLQLKKRGALGC